MKEFLFIALMGLGIAGLAVLAKIEVIGGNGYYEREYDWSYKGKDYHLNLEIDKGLYEHYHSMPKDWEAFYYTREDEGYEYAAPVATALKNLARGEHFNERQTIEFVSAFIQAIPYAYDDDTTRDYRKTLIEYLVEKKGDCTDCSCAIATLVSYLNKPSILINYPGHQGCAVACTSCTGTYYRYGNVKYYYIEGTDQGWRLGVLPDVMVGKPVEAIYPIPAKERGRLTTPRQRTNAQAQACAFCFSAYNESTSGFHAGIFLVNQTKQHEYNQQCR